MRHSLSVSPPIEQSFLQLGFGNDKTISKHGLKLSSLFYLDQYDVLLNFG